MGRHYRLIRYLNLACSWRKDKSFQLYYFLCFIFTIHFIFLFCFKSDLQAHMWTADLDLGRIWQQLLPCQRFLCILGLIVHFQNIFSPFNLFTITQKQTFTFMHFEGGRYFQDGCHEATSSVFSISFSRLTFSWTEKQHRYWSFWIYILEYWHEIWDIYYA